MTTLFNRQGTEKQPVGRDQKNRPYAIEPRACTRCGGRGGSDGWKFTGWTCYDCGGSGKHRNGPATIRLYTADELAKLDAAADKRQAKKLAAYEAAVAQRAAEAAARQEAFLTEYGLLIERLRRHEARSEFLADVLAKALRQNQITEPQVAAVTKVMDRIEAEDARKAAAGWVGKVGERITLDVEVVRVATFEGDYGLVQITTLHDDAGNTLVVKSGAWTPEKGARRRIVGTVKKHDTYRDELQTVLQRVKVIEGEAA